MFNQRSNIVHLFRFPKDGVVLYAELLDQGQELLLEKETGIATLVPILGLLQIASAKDENSNIIQQGKDNEEKDYVKEQTKPGRLVVYGDSNCIDDRSLQKCTYCRVYILILENNK